MHKITRPQNTKGFGYKGDINMRNFDELVKHFGDIEINADRGLEDVQSDSYECFLKDNMTEEEIDNTNIVDLWKAVENYVESRI